MAHRYCSPPNWPAPPPGWTPPAGWVPDPSWGPAPEGWEFWKPARPNTSAFGWALGSAFAWYALVIVGLVAATGIFNPEEAGRLFAGYLLGGLGVGLTARLMSWRWPQWLYPIAVIPAVVVFVALSNAGRMSG